MAIMFNMGISWVDGGYGDSFGAGFSYPVLVLHVAMVILLGV